MNHPHDKTCTQCKQAYEELYDSYSALCPECHSEFKGLLSKTEGGWNWNEAK